jgi:hypothetical protein
LHPVTAHARKPRPVNLYREDDGDLVLVFGAEILASDLAAALAELPADGMLWALGVSYFCGADGCRGQPEEDDEHVYFAASLHIDPADLPESAPIPATIEGLDDAV